MLSPEGRGEVCKDDTFWGCANKLYPQMVSSAREKKGDNMILVYRGVCPDGHVTLLEIDENEEIDERNWCRKCGKAAEFKLYYSYDPEGGVVL